PLSRSMINVSLSIVSCETVGVLTLKRASEPTRCDIFAAPSKLRPIHGAHRSVAEPVSRRSDTTARKYGPGTIGPFVRTERRVEQRFATRKRRPFAAFVRPEPCRRGRDCHLIRVDTHYAADG